MGEKMRLQRMIAMSGLASRRKAEAYIAAGKVQVNGRRAEIGDSVDVKKDLVTVDGKQISLAQERVYLVLHKPRGFVTTMQDERDRKCVASLVADVGARVYPVGRLDKDSEGLLIMTNDGDFANLIMHPSNHIAKTYRVTVRPAATEEQLNQISIGIEIDGKRTAPAKVRVVGEESGRAVLEIVLYEGRNREIRKMCEAIGLEVARLKRIAEGPVRLKMLKAGTHRPLTNEEIQGLRRVAQKKKEEKGASRHDRNHTDAKQRNGPDTAGSRRRPDGGRRGAGHAGRRKKPGTSNRQR